MCSITVCYQMPRKDANPLQVPLLRGVMMIQGKSHSLASGREFSQSSYPSRDAIQRPAWAPVTSKEAGPWQSMEQPLAFSKGLL